MQNWITTASNHNAHDAKQPHPQVATATNQHDATGTATENHSDPEEYVKVHYENPFEDPHYYERFGDEARNKFTIEHELGLRKCKNGPWVTKKSYAEHYASNTSSVPETFLPLAQPHTCTELTESDTELLAASELHNEFTYNTTMPNERPNQDEILVDELSCNDYEPTPIIQEFNDANTLSLEQWLLKTIPKYNALYPAAPLLNTTHELN